MHISYGNDDRDSESVACDRVFRSCGGRTTGLREVTVVLLRGQNARECLGEGMRSQCR